jgi:hypothetical protein
MQVFSYSFGTILYRTVLAYKEAAPAWKPLGAFLRSRETFQAGALAFKMTCFFVRSPRWLVAFGRAMAPRKPSPFTSDAELKELVRTEVLIAALRILQIRGDVESGSDICKKAKIKGTHPLPAPQKRNNAAQGEQAADDNSWTKPRKRRDTADSAKAVDYLMHFSHQAYEISLIKKKASPEPVKKPPSPPEKPVEKPLLDGISSWLERNYGTDPHLGPLLSLVNHNAREVSASLAIAHVLGIEKKDLIDAAGLLAGSYVVHRFDSDGRCVVTDLLTIDNYNETTGALTFSKKAVLGDGSVAKKDGFLIPIEKDFLVFCEILGGTPHGKGSQPAFTLVKHPERSNDFMIGICLDVDHKDKYPWATRVYMGRVAGDTEIVPSMRKIEDCQEAFWYLLDSIIGIQSAGKSSRDDPLGSLGRTFGIHYKSAVTSDERRTLNLQNGADLVSDATRGS